ncbi:MAG: VIT1/CCC1 transporter family protein [Pseudomonadota bacterium]
MDLEHEHSADAIRLRLASGPSVNYLRDWIYGGIDGAITTFAIVAGAVGASLSPGIVIILGIANLIADGFSMAASNYSGTKSERDDYMRLRAMEERHIALYPEGEREEIRQIFAAKGYSGSDLDRMVDLVTEHKSQWIDTMLTEEHGVALVQRVPLIAGLSTLAAFVLCGTVPLLPFVFDLTQAAWLSTGLVALVFFAIGSVKSRWSTDHWLHSGLETLAIGLVAALVAYGIGALLRGIVPI